ncbi:MAG: hypothetical protein QXU79_02970, partial [Candidatus Micrarchaeaceae archaeon]
MLPIGGRGPACFPASRPALDIALCRLTPPTHLYVLLLLIRLAVGGRRDGPPNDAGQDDDGGQVGGHEEELGGDGHA